MQDLGHNMDDLMRKAADNYPLKTGESNWEAVASELIVPPFPATKRNNKKNYGIAIIFIILFLFTGDIILKQPGNIKRPAHYTSSERSSKNTNTSNLSSAFDPRDLTKTEVHKINVKNVLKVVPVNNRPAKELTSWSTEHSIRISQIQTNSGISNTSEPASTLASKITSVVANAQPGISIVGEKNTAIDSLNQLTGKSKNIRQSRSSFYLGVVAGPEFNEVKNQGLKKSGFDAGILGGYKFSRKLSVETGLLFSRKYYFSDGKHFNMKMPGMEVLSLEGSCTLFEIPIKLRYDLFNRNNSVVFSSAGLSSYLLTREKNNYLTLVNGTEQKMIASYKESCRYFAATIDLSIGYEYILDKSTNLRIEPYLQIPLKGIGVGTMPVKSAGMHIGFTRSIR